MPGARRVLPAFPLVRWEPASPKRGGAAAVTQMSSFDLRGISWPMNCSAALDQQREQLPAIH